MILHSFPISSQAGFEWSSDSDTYAVSKDIIFTYFGVRQNITSHIFLYIRVLRVTILVT